MFYLIHINRYQINGSLNMVSSSSSISDLFALCAKKLATDDKRKKAAADIDNLAPVSRLQVSSKVRRFINWSNSFTWLLSLQRLLFSRRSTNPWKIAVNRYPGALHQLVTLPVGLVAPNEIQVANTIIIAKMHVRTLKARAAFQLSSSVTELG